MLFATLILTSLFVATDMLFAMMIGPSSVNWGSGVNTPVVGQLVWIWMFASIVFVAFCGIVIGVKIVIFCGLCVHVCASADIDIVKVRVVNNTDKP